MRLLKKNDVVVAARAKRAGMHHALKIAQEAREAGLSYDLGYALVEQETTDGKNVFGHDASIFRGAGRVTKRKYLAYRTLRRATGNTKMQGVGLTQPTWWEFQDECDALGGCWRPRIQLRWSFRHLRALIKEHGLIKGAARYNGSGPDADRYSIELRAKRARWRRILNP